MKDIDLANVPEERVPAITFFYVDDSESVSGEIVGMINIRLQLNDFLTKEGGHIGYSIRPTMRGKGHGSEMLKKALIFCRRIGLCDFILTCDKDNIPSAKIIENNGGILESEFFSETFECEVCRYIIH